MIKKQIFLIVGLLLGFSTLYGEKAPNNDEILKAIVSSDSQYYYPSLMIRYEGGDTTLTLDEYHHLYYGYAWQTNYRPLESNVAEIRMLDVLSGVGEDSNPSAEQAERIVRWGNEIMEIDPFSPSNLNFLAYAYAILGDTLKASQYSDRMRKVLATIEGSGTGLKENSPWHILFFTHANDFLASRDETIVKRTVRTKTVEYAHLLRLKKSDKAKGYYFDFGRIYWKKPEGIENRKRVAGFELNGIPLGGRKGRYNPSR